MRTLQIVRDVQNSSKWNIPTLKQSICSFRTENKGIIAIHTIEYCVAMKQNKQSLNRGLVHPGLRGIDGYQKN